MASSVVVLFPSPMAAVLSPPSLSFSKTFSKTPVLFRVRVQVLGGGWDERKRTRHLVTRVQKTESEPILSEAEKEVEGSKESKGVNLVNDDVSKKLSKAVRSTASTFAPRASTRQKNPAVPGSTLYSIFEWQAYISMAFGGLLAFNLLFPSEEPDIWRLMGMWSVWMFTIPSLRARDCTAKEKEALNYLFLLVPLINVTLPLVWRSFAAVWTADVAAFLVMYAWKMEWLSKEESS